jgi:four helix bundle protein
LQPLPVNGHIQGVLRVQVVAWALLSTRAMNAKAEEMIARTQAFLMRVIAFCEGLPSTLAAQRYKGQLMDAAGGLHSNYRSACRARSTKEFIAKVGVAAEEADECVGWLETLRKAKCGNGPEQAALEQEAVELTKILTASQKTARRNELMRARLSRQRR